HGQGHHEEGRHDEEGRDEEVVLSGRGWWAIGLRCRMSGTVPLKPVADAARSVRKSGMFQRRNFSKYQERNPP
ncbi:MAG TPA: hypothetical protein VH913_18200, partial [Hyphomicrobiaceae bacterium]